MILDERDHIGPHHLSIGKTRKFFDDGRFLFSMGNRISDGTPSAFGDGAFCVDGMGVVYIARGRVRVNYIHRQHSGKCIYDDGDGTLAAPWLCHGLDGRPWWSVLCRDGKHRVGVGEKSAEFDFGWYHSALQVMPYEVGKAWIIGFSASPFPIKSTLMACEVNDKLEFGIPFALDECDVNDRLTFHFQAVASDGPVSVVYLKNKLGVYQMEFRGGDWSRRRITDQSSFAPQNVLHPDGSVSVLWADYRETVFLNGAVVLCGGPNILALFGMTGYGTGGMIAPARWAEKDNIPYLISRIVNEQTGRARLELRWTRSDENLPDDLDTNERLASNPALITDTFRRMV